MECSILSIHTNRFRYFTLIALAITIAASILLLIFSQNSAHAVTTVPTKMNFQGRLTDSSGNIKPDGLYNMKFRLFTVNSGGTDVWNETRETTNRVQVTNGLFSVRLGDATAIPASLFASGSLYLEIELPTPATATCSTASCATYGEGPMTPRNQLAASAYSYSSETLDGLDSSAFVQTASNNVLTGSNTVKTTSTTALQVQNASTTPLFVADTSSSRVYIGNPTGDTTGALLVLDTKTSSGDPSGLNGGMYYNSNTGDFRCYVDGGWQSCQAHSASMSSLVSGGTTTMSSTSYANLTTPSSISYTKLGGSNTKLVITMSATMYTTVSAGTSAYLGVNVDSTDYDCGNLYFNQINIYNTVSCSVTIPNLSAGAKTVQMRWKRGLGTGSLNSSSGAAWNSMTVTETN